MYKAHFQKMNRIITLLQNENRKDPYVLAVILTESYFRNQVIMFFEILYWYYCSFFRPGRMKKISIGYAQVQIEHWVTFGYFNSVYPSVKNANMIFDPVLNYDICSKYLTSTGILANNSLSYVAKTYRGKIGLYYLDTITFYYNQVISMRSCHGV